MSLSYSTFHPKPSKTYTYKIDIYNDMGHFWYSDIFDLPNVITNRITHQGGITTQHYRLKDGLSKNWKYSFTNDNDIYNLNVAFDF